MTPDAYRKRGPSVKKSTIVLKIFVFKKDRPYFDSFKHCSSDRFDLCRGIIIRAFINSRKKCLPDNLKSISYQLESKIHTYRDSLLFLATALTQELSSQAQTLINTISFKNTIVPLFHSVRFPQADIKGITLYTTIDLYDHGQYVKKNYCWHGATFQRETLDWNSHVFLTKNGGTFFYTNLF